MSKTENSAVCTGCRNKLTPRTEAEQRQLQHRLNRMIGQLGGISRMIDENRYCGDVLIQVAAVQRALTSFGEIVLQNHLETCVADQIRSGNQEVIAETMELIRKLK